MEWIASLSRTTFAIATRASITLSTVIPWRRLSKCSATEVRTCSSETKIPLNRLSYRWNCSHNYSKPCRFVHKQCTWLLSRPLTHQPQTNSPVHFVLVDCWAHSESTLLAWQVLELLHCLQLLRLCSCLARAKFATLAILSLEPLLAMMLSASWLETTSSADWEIQQHSDVPAGLCKTDDRQRVASCGIVVDCPLALKMRSAFFWLNVTLCGTADPVGHLIAITKGCSCAAMSNK